MNRKTSDAKVPGMSRKMKPHAPKTDPKNVPKNDTKNDTKKIPKKSNGDSFVKILQDAPGP